MPSFQTPTHHWHSLGVTAVIPCPTFRSFVSSADLSKYPAPCALVKKGRDGLWCVVRTRDTCVFVSVNGAFLLIDIYVELPNFEAQRPTNQGWNASWPVLCATFV
jgi:hypothetical protein